MIIQRNLTGFVVFSGDSVLDALKKITANKSRIVFAVSDNGVLEGVLTDGDFRRWLSSQEDIDLDQPVSIAMNREFLVGSVDEDPAITESRFRESVDHVPLVDASQRIVAIAARTERGIAIEGRVIDGDAPAFLIAEIGNNHNGSLELAKKLIDHAAEAGADCAKFQMRSMDALYREGGHAADGSDDLGAQYTLDLLARFQLKDEELFAAFDHCREKGLVPLCTPWDETSLAKLETYGMQAYKVASADLTNHPFLEALAATGKPLIVSTGMSTEAEIRQSVALLRKHAARFVLLHCNSTYPAPFKDINLAYLKRLAELGGCLVGYSGHERDVYVAIAAVANGAKVVEKHFTLDRNMEGNDHRVSLLPGEFARMVQGIRQVEAALGSGAERKITQGEMMNRETLAKSVVAKERIEAGQAITAPMLDVKSPGNGLQPNRLHELVGRKARRRMEPGALFFPSDLEDVAATPRHYRFERPWGIPVRYHDFRRLRHVTNLSLIEFHLSYKDMELDPQQFLDEPADLHLVVHSPELFAGDHVLDLCSADASYREHSIAELQRVIDVTRRIAPFFKLSPRPCIVTNVGGFTADAHLPPSAVGELYERLAESLARLDMSGVEIIPQTMPPFPWHFGGQRYHNLFVSGEEIAAFCAKHGMRVCLDVSHSKLACNHQRWSFHEFLTAVGPYTAHLHMADASGVDGEGLQIGEGDVDWVSACATLDRVAPEATFIPEIWQGHKNEGEGFWVALDRLEDAWRRASQVEDTQPRLPALRAEPARTRVPLS
jgi:sialic acid synthase SpsE/sugar phosphate isomerase/epimerase